MTSRKSSRKTSGRAGRQLSGKAGRQANRQATAAQAKKQTATQAAKPTIAQAKKANRHPSQTAASQQVSSAVLGRRMRYARYVTLTLLLLVVVGSLAFDTGWGTASAVGIGEFFLICPLGALEAMLAGKVFLPAAFVSLTVVLIIALVAGRAWCSWGCPASVLRKLRGNTSNLTSARRQPPLPTPKPPSPPAAFVAKQAATAEHMPTEHMPAGRIKALLKASLHDPRIFVLAGVLVVTLVVGLPLFCLVCPIGLCFGTITALWHLLVLKELTLSVVVFPLALAVELILYRKWCLNLCPIGALLALCGRFARTLRPQINVERCRLYTSGSFCHNCEKACQEGIRLHEADAAVELGDCTRCGACLEACPANAIRIKLQPEANVLYRP